MAMTRLVVNGKDAKVITLTPDEEAKEIADAEARAKEPPPPEPTTEEKLKAFGLSVDELKAALGIK